MISIYFFSLLITVFLIYLTKGILDYLGLKQVVRSDGPQSHLVKKGILTSGGLLLPLPLILIYVMCFTINRWPFTWQVVHWSELLWLCACYFSFLIIGFFDDYSKVKAGKGFSMGVKFSLQILIAILLGYLFPGSYWINFFGWTLSIGLFFPFWCALVLVSTANAVNLSDGLDGLVCLPLCVIFFALYLITPFSISDISQMTLIFSAMTLGFLFFNRYPATIFLGDSGSMSLGAMLGAIALVYHMELYLIIMGALFVVETISVAIQICSFKCYGKRVFKMAPIHHHFELSGWSEPQVVLLFWMFSIIMTSAGVLCFFMLES
ncbi:MAG: phospho-N-acetylmuramoyl-pentapeptide-transferase [Legionellales bacterium]|nr:phospho-N-acetylmuramoyl-pentapeptide-transferase [Legionellales bacterium]OUX67325.1 MAG: phospho-N-acetylmuramoyl-pentapeptide-transferase [bacterium TMED178]|tara:strand:+ start:1541 stop:2503 length:963 start_codon:yes stop_codon:yes gene_type:complete